MQFSGECLDSERGDDLNVGNLSSLLRREANLGLAAIYWWGRGMLNRDWLLCWHGQREANLGLAAKLGGLRGGGINLA